MSRARPPTIEIYPMMRLDDGSSTIHEGTGEPHFYDVIVRYEGDDPLDESEDHPSYERAVEAAEKFQEKYTGADIQDISA